MRNVPKKVLFYSDFHFYGFFSYCDRNHGCPRKQSKDFSGRIDICNKDIVRFVFNMAARETEMGIVKANLIPFPAFNCDASFLKLHNSHCNGRFIVIKAAVTIKNAKKCKQK